MTQEVLDPPGTAVWPQGQKYARWRGETVFLTKFTDTAAYHPALRATIMRLAQDSPLAAPFDGMVGSRKVFDIESWDCPAARLLHARALALFEMALGPGPAVVDLSWATLYRKGDHCMAHSHPRAYASLVYFLDPGEIDPQGNEGTFLFADPRMQICCPEEEGCMSHPCAPAGAEGLLLLFPGKTVHMVTPYFGETPRITLSWNINRAAIPGRQLSERIREKMWEIHGKHAWP
ncbi:MAG: putative 2OG-Fe(II) oxygenase [Rhodovibrionaceae bacterium]